MLGSGCNEGAGNPITHPGLRFRAIGSTWITCRWLFPPPGMATGDVTISSMLALRGPTGRCAPLSAPRLGVGRRSAPNAQANGRGAWSCSTECNTRSSGGAATRRRAGCQSAVVSASLRGIQPAKHVRQYNERHNAGGGCSCMNNQVRGKDHIHGQSLQITRDCGGQTSVPALLHGVAPATLLCLLGARRLIPSAKLRRRVRVRARMTPTPPDRAGTPGPGA